MNKDPYLILGVAYDATDEQIKAAYRDLARHNHPDNFTDPAQIASAEERMKEINEAYNAIRRMRSGAETGGTSHSGSGENAPILARARASIRAGRFDDADRALESIAPSERNAEWNFLKGCVLTQKGWYFDAQKHLETACYMDPTNTEDRDFLNNICSAASTYGRGYRSDAPGASVDVCDICMSLACLDCMCDCCGGDFIRCC